MAKAQHARRYQTLPAFLRQLRQDAGWTQRQLGQKLRLTHVSVHKSETGERRVDITEFADWCRACRIDPQDAFARWLEQAGR